MRDGKQRPELGGQVGMYLLALVGRKGEAPTLMEMRPSRPC